MHIPKNRVSANYNQTLKIVIYIYIYAFPNSLFFLVQITFPHILWSYPTAME